MARGFSHGAAATDAAIAEWCLNWDEPGAANIRTPKAERRLRRRFDEAVSAIS